MQKYFYDEETIIDAGPLGIIAQSGMLRSDSKFRRLWIWIS